MSSLDDFLIVGDVLSRPIRLILGRVAHRWALKSDDRSSISNRVWTGCIVVVAIGSAGYLLKRLRDSSDASTSQAFAPRVLLIRPTSGTIVTVYVMPTDVEVCDNFFETFVPDLSHETCLGLDAEWQAWTKQRLGISLLQISTSNKCFIFHVGAMSCLPSSLISLLENKSVAKAGVGIEEDVKRLALGHGVNFQSALDLRVLARHCGHTAEKNGLSALASGTYRRTPIEGTVVKLWIHLHLGYSEVSHL